MRFLSTSVEKARAASASRPLLPPATCSGWLLCATGFLPLPLRATSSTWEHRLDPLVSSWRSLQCTRCPVRRSEAIRPRTSCTRSRSPLFHPCGCKTIPLINPLLIARYTGLRFASRPRSRCTHVQTPCCAGTMLVCKGVSSQVCCSLRGVATS